MDPVSDLFIRIKNAYKAGHESAHIPYSKFKYEIAVLLRRAGFVGEVERKGKRARKTIEVLLRYGGEGSPAINGIKLISRPSRRLYAPYRALKPSQRGGIIIVSTPAGMKSVEEARKEKVGGQLIAEVW